MLWWPMVRELTGHESWLIECVGPEMVPDYEIYCSVCGNRSPVVVAHPRLRETVVCQVCGSFSRQRQIAYIVSGGSNLVRFANETELDIYNTESYGAIHNGLCRAASYMCSEYLEPRCIPGQVYGGRRHEDIERLSFQDATFDLVVSSDVFEHVRHPYVGFAEVCRVLKPGGRHVFTVPFCQDRLTDRIMATPVGDDGIEFHGPPLYHEDCMRTEGSLVYTIFAPSMLFKLHQIGFDTRVHWLYDGDRGIVGVDALVFESTKRRPE